MPTTVELDCVYAAMIAAGVPCENHESDLYVPRTEASLAVLARFPGVHWSVFIRSDRAQAPWIDVPFMYEPWWTARRGAK